MSNPFHKPLSGDALVHLAMLARDQEIRIIQVEEEQARLKAEQGRIADGQKIIAARQTALEIACTEFTVLGYANYREIRLDLTSANKIGRRATVLLKEMNLPVGKVRDPRFGLVNSYAEPVLEQAFEEAIKTVEF